MSKLQPLIPGTELGVSAFKFTEYVEAMGMRRIVHFDKTQKLVFEPDKLTSEDINEIPDNILRMMKEHAWAREAINDFTPVFIRSYEILQLQSKRGANKWLEQILQRHGSFLAKQGVLTAMSK